MKIIFGLVGGKPEISQLDGVMFLNIHKNVVRFHVAMDHPFLMHVVQSINDLSRDVLDFFFREWFFLVNSFLNVF